MIFEQPFHSHLSAHQEGQSTLPIPMIYEHLPVPPLAWEYHVLTADTSEQALPDVEQLNALGREGWILVTAVEERVYESRTRVHFYFCRQAQEETKK
jgi:hypothetical protein